LAFLNLTWGGDPELVGVMKKKIESLLSDLPNLNKRADEKNER